MPNDERKGRRLGDETKERIADLASGWTVDGDSPPEPPRRDTSAPIRVPRDPSRPIKPPPPPGSAERKVRDDKPADRSSLRGEPVDLSGVPEGDRTQQNRGAVGIKHDRADGRTASLTANAASGTIIGDTPPPLFDKPAIAIRPAGTGPNAAVHGTPKPDATPGAAEGSASGPVKRSPSVPVATPPMRSQSVPVAGPPMRSAPVAVPAAAPPMRSAPAPAAVPVALPAAGEPGASSSGRLAVPVGEFDHGETVIEQDKLRAAYSQATIVRDPASALLGLAAASPPPVPPAAADDADDADAVPGAAAAGAGGEVNDFSGALTIEHTADPTVSDTGGAAGDRADATTLSPPLSQPGERAERSDRPDRRSGRNERAAGPRWAAVPRRPGLLGDLRYPASVVLGLRAARAALATQLARQATRRQSRRHHLVTLGRTAVALVETVAPDVAASEPAEHAALGPARAQLHTIDDERARHAQRSGDADSELAEVRRARDARAKQHASDVAALDAELAAGAAKLAPLERQAAAIRRRGVKLYDAMARIDARVAAAEAKLGAVTGGKLDRAAVEAEIAMQRADRKSVAADEPAIIAELDALTPRIAALEAARHDAEQKLRELVADEQEDQRRVEELLAAIGAQRKVVDRAAAAAEARRDKVLFELGERLCIDRPASLKAQLSPLDAIDVELGTADRRIMELREIATSVDRAKVARGVVWLVLAIGALGAVVVWLVPMFQ